MKKNKFSPFDLDKEKNLFSLWKTSFKFKKPYFNIISTTLVFLLLVFYCYLSINNPYYIFSLLRKIESLGFSFATSILGFLVAGFTIFVTVSKTEIFVKMAAMEKGNTGESILKYNLSAFIVVFAHYIFYIFICIIIEIFFPQKGFANLIFFQLTKFDVFSKNRIFIYELFSFSFFIIFCSWTVYLILLLKSFIYNIYQVATTSIRYDLEINKKK